MKKLLIPGLALLISGVIISCQKEKNEPTVTVTASKTADIKRNETVVFRFSGAGAGDSVIWSVNPSAGVQISGSGNTTSLKFATAGNYTVSARFGAKASAVNVSVTNQIADSTSGGGGGNTSSDTTLPIAPSDKIRISLQRGASDSLASVLYLSALTSNSYNCLNNSLSYTLNTSANAFAINYTGIFTPAFCSSGSAQARALTTLASVANGTSTLTIKVRGVNYSGTIQRNGNSYSVNWPDSSAVAISPLSL
jgi:hypothetical protein